MCQGDLSLYHYDWIPGREKPLPVAQMDHICIDWDRMIEWASERSFGMGDRLLTNPNFGKWPIRWNY
jgi:hypothetical protein